VVTYLPSLGNMLSKAWKHAFQYFGNMLTSTVETCLPILWKHAYQYFGNMLTSTLVIYWSILSHIELSDIKDKSLIRYNPFVKSLE
jgi:hypothetical protein